MPKQAGGALFSQLNFLNLNWLYEAKYNSLPCLWCALLISNPRIPCDMFNGRVGTSATRQTVTLMDLAGP